ncbi:metal ABC transporter substrate-binding protein [uncultured Solobacterium sp.]|jgi:putative adhesion lipoprotein|uniref:metal ABC transporter substrate-binding protein n=1 Tax=uncultured Solobacterium sp. TaxID=747375 RepID=UPI001CAAA91F|nr:metal ABC transporter substrate-binding protein [uncultured Solobacterium sp.]MBF1122973.1 zinc ABC transporter substrate-binding protein [Solobacterium sp.]
MKLKKLMTGVLAAFMLAGCAPKQQQNTTKLKIVATTFPQYDWIREIIGKDNTNVDLQLLMKNGGDLHSYQPTAGDIANIADANLFVYVGGESDEWVDDALKEKTNKDMKVVNMMQTLGDDIDEEEEGLEKESEDHDHEEIEYDEHVWLSLKRAQKIVKAIADELGELDSTNAKKYQENAEAYIAKLAALDKSYESTVNTVKNKTWIFADRMPFHYLAKDYGITTYAAFNGCSTETNASFNTIVSLAKYADELGIKHIMTIEGSDKKLAKAVIENTTDKNQDILTLNSLQSVSQSDIDKGLTYYGAMEENLKVLAQSFNTEVK